MGAVGALLGWRPMLSVLVVSIILGGLLAIIYMSLSKRVKQTLWNLVGLAKGLVRLGVRPNPKISLDNPVLLKLPFGVTVAAATVFSFVWMHWRH